MAESLRVVTLLNQLCSGVGDEFFNFTVLTRFFFNINDDSATVLRQCLFVSYFRKKRSFYMFLVPRKR